MFPDPGFIEAKLVQPLAQLQITLQCQRRVFTDRVERRQKHAVPEGNYHTQYNTVSGHVLSSGDKHQEVHP
jgi:hypothetical protein